MMWTTIWVAASLVCGLAVGFKAGASWERMPNPEDWYEFRTTKEDD